MGWWPVDASAGDDLTGDGPADALGAAVDALFAAFAAREHHVRRVPAVAELLHGLNEARRATRAPQVFVLRRSDGSVLRPAATIGNAEVAPFVAAFERVAAEYQHALHRAPRDREWVGCLEFCTGVDFAEGRFADGVVQLTISLGADAEMATTDVALHDASEELDPFAHPLESAIDDEMLERMNEVSDRLAAEDDPEVAAALVLAETEAVRAVIAEHRANGVDVLARRDPVALIREIALRTADTDHELVEAASTATDLDARLAAARSTTAAMPTGVCERLARDASPRVRALIACRASADDPIARTLARDPHPLVRASSAAVGANVLDALSLHAHATVRRAVARNPSARPATLERLAHDIVDVAIEVAKNRHAPAAITTALARHTDPQIRAAVAGNAEAPEAVLRELLADPQPEVRRALLTLAQVRRLSKEALQTLIQDPALGSGFAADAARKRARRELARRGQ